MIPLLHLRLKQKRYGQRVVLGAKELKLDPGARVAITAPSGAGKSTLLGILAGLDTDYDGELEALGQSLTQASHTTRARFRAQHVGLISQVPRLLLGHTGRQNLALTDRLLGRTHDAERARDLAMSLGLGSVFDQPVERMSGGERQRLTLVRALLHRPALVFADEPTGNLDAVHTQRLLDCLFAELPPEGACVIASHDPAVVERCNARVML